MAVVSFELDGIEYELPDYLSIGDYVKIFKIKDLFEDEYMMAKVINLVTGCPVDTLLEAENHKVEFLSTSIFAMVPRPPYTLIDRFELNGVHYGYLPSYKEISFGEFVDLDTLLNRKPEEIMENLHLITAMMYRPIVSQKSEHNFKIEKYNLETLEERAELFKNKLDVKFALGGQFFFINFGKIYTSFTPLSLRQKFQREWMALKEIWTYRTLVWKIALKKDLDGMSPSIEYAKITLQNTMKSLKKRLSKS
jgi:hypothetical protein